MGTFKTLLAFTFGGAILGDALATLIAPGIIVWNITPGSGIQQTICNPEVFHTTISQLIHWQLIGAGLGAMACLVLGILILRWSGRRAARPTASPGPPPPST